LTVATPPFLPLNIQVTSIIPITLAELGGLTTAEAQKELRGTGRAVKGEILFSRFGKL